MAKETCVKVRVVGNLKGIVPRKILENWFYWIVINIVSVWLYLDRGLELTAGLFVLYIALSISGYLSWRKTLITA